MWWMLFPRWIWFLASLCVWMGPPRATAMPRSAPSHAGICPNEMNPNLWVDAMSTCTRECEHDQACESSEKCCSNVCGTRSCVAARHLDADNNNKGPAGGAAAQGPTCAGSTCPQQGSTCDIWDGQPVCRCLDRCEREPLFTCASDGMTYYNRCYMDAEACSKGTSLSVVPCRFHLTWPSTSPSLPPRTTTTPRPTTATLPAATTAAAAAAAAPEPPARPLAPVLLSTPVHQAVAVGDTASFLCNVAGRPRPDITWEKQREPAAGGGDGGGERVLLRPNTVRGNMVVTNIGQLVVYNSQPGDSGVYTCTAQSPLGAVAAHHPLTVVPDQPPPAAAADDDPPPGAQNVSRCLPEACVGPPGGGAAGNSSGADGADGAEDCGGDQEKVVWYYEPASNSCLSLTSCPGNGSSSSDGDSPPQGPQGRAFPSYEACMRCCGPEPSGPCGLPSLQGPCKAYEPRWAYSGALLQCQSFIYGGCHGNDNNFESKEACEETCPFPRNSHHHHHHHLQHHLHHHLHPRCKACRSRGRMVTSFCRSDFVILGRMTEVTEEDGDSGHALVTIEEILKDDKMGLRFFGREPLEVTFAAMDWSCPCPNVTGAGATGAGGGAGGQVIVMGDVSEGAAVLRPESYVGAASARRLRKLREVIAKNTCDILRDMADGPQ